jgi:hypothetical protein
MIEGSGSGPDPDPYLWLMLPDLDPGGTTTYGSYGSGSAGLFRSSRYRWSRYLDSEEVLLALLLMLEVVLGQHLLYPLLNRVTDKEPATIIGPVPYNQCSGSVIFWYNSGCGSRSGSCCFRQWPSRCQQNIIFSPNFFCLFVFEGTFTSITHQR